MQQTNKVVLKLFLHVVQLSKSSRHNCSKICSTTSFMGTHVELWGLIISHSWGQMLTSSYLLRKLERPCQRSSQSAATPAQSHCYFCWGRRPSRRWSVKQKHKLCEEQVLISCQITLKVTQHLLHIPKEGVFSFRTLQCTRVLHSCSTNEEIHTCFKSAKRERRVYKSAAPMQIFIILTFLLLILDSYL